MTSSTVSHKFVSGNPAVAGLLTEPLAAQETYGRYFRGVGRPRCTGDRYSTANELARRSTSRGFLFVRVGTTTELLALSDKPTVAPSLVVVSKGATQLHDHSGQACPILDTGAVGCDPESRILLCT